MRDTYEAKNGQVEWGEDQVVVTSGRRLRTVAMDDVTGIVYHPAALLAAGHFTIATGVDGIATPDDREFTLRVSEGKMARAFNELSSRIRERAGLSLERDGSRDGALAGPVIPLLSLSAVPGRDVVGLHGLVSGVAVMARNSAAKDGLSDRLTLVGGADQGLEGAIARAMVGAQQRMARAAQARGADHVIGVSTGLERVSDNGMAVMLTGTAVSTRGPGADISDKPDG